MSCLPRGHFSESELAFLSVAELAPLVKKRKVSPVKLVEMLLARIERLNPKLNAYLTVCTELARQQARQAEREIARGRYRGPLHGIPMSLKDNIWTRGIRTTAGSLVLRDFVPQEDATVAARLRAAGAVLLGKTNLHEFAYGVTTNNPHYGPTRNPWDLDRIPGGSSGGSAAALCGIAGVKPTFGRVSCHGVIPLAKTLDHVGPLARNVEDLAIVLRVVAGRDPRDATSAQMPVPDFARETTKPLGHVRLGWPRNYFFDGVDGEVRRCVEAAAQCLEKLGAKIEEVSLPLLEESVDRSTHIALAEARAHHEAAGYFPARAAEYSEEVRKRLEMGADVRAVDYLRAFDVQKAVQACFAAAFERVDAILAPTTPVAAPRIGEKLIKIAGKEEPVRGALLRLNRPANFTGLPAVSIPCGFTKSGLPIGLQLIGQAFDEGRLLRIARAYEQANDWRRRRPPGI